MAVTWVGDDFPVTVPDLPETDGLLDYLHTLSRVAHAAGASHWCTPGHNRGRVRAAGAFAAPSLVPFPLHRREGSR